MIFVALSWGHVIAKSNLKMVLSKNIGKYMT